MAYEPKPPKIRKAKAAPPPVQVRKRTPTTAGQGGPGANVAFLYPNQPGKRNATPLTSGKQYRTGANQYGNVLAGGKQFRIGPTTILNPVKSKKPTLPTWEQLKSILQGGGRDTESPSGVAGVRG
jgi:hypothetical protein